MTKFAVAQKLISKYAIFILDRKEIHRSGLQVALAEKVAAVHTAIIWRVCTMGLSLSNIYV